MKVVVAGQWSWRNPDYPATHNLWQVRSRFDLGKASRAELNSAADEVIKILLRDLEQAGVSFVSDGGIRRDSVYDVTRKIEGCYDFKNLVRIGGPHQATNTFARQPTAGRGLSYGGPSLYFTASLLNNDLKFLKEHTRLPVVMCLPGPYSCARHTANVNEFWIIELASSYAIALNREIGALIENGADLVRIEEPQILNYKDDFKFFPRLMERLTYGLDINRIALATWFRPVNDLANYFYLPFGAFFVDLVEGINTLNALRDFPPGKKLVAGIFDARHSHVEDELNLTYLLEAVLDHVPEKNVILSANSDLQFMPWGESMAKVRRMVEFAKSWEISQW